MEQIRSTTISGNKLLVGSFVIVVVSACIFSAMGYYYLNYRNMLMQRAVAKSSKMSLWVVAHNLEKEIISRENRMLLEFMSLGTKKYELDSLHRLQKDNPIVEKLFFYHPEGSLAGIGDRKPGLEEWLSQKVKLVIEQTEPPPLALQHYAGVFDGKPVQAGYLRLPEARSHSNAKYLLFIVNIDFVRSALLPEQLAPTATPLLEISIRDQTSRQSGADNKEGAEALKVEAHFTDILPFWSVTANLETTGMNKRARMELIIYSAIIILVFFLIVLSVYFIWGQMQQERRLSIVKSQMISHVSHELKTPLALVRMFTETLMLGRVKGPKKIHNYYRIILSECDRLHLLINNTLDFSSIEKGMKEYNFNVGNLPEAVHDMITSYNYYLEQHGFSFQTDIDPAIPPFPFDKVAMAQIIGNLLDNAMKFSPGTKDIRLKLMQTNDTVLLEVSDHGIGMKKSDVDTIFKPYHRLSHRFRGSGIGLSLVSHAVEAHRGTIHVESYEGKGTVFSISFPLTTREGNA